MKPVWLLDIDGVINAITHEWPPTRGWEAEHWALDQVESFVPDDVWPIRWSQPVVDFINEVHASGLAEIRWHTTWQEAAHNISKALELPEFEIAKAPERLEFREREWWKLGAARRVLMEEKRPLVWTDDDISYGMDDLQRSAMRRTGQGALLVSPDSSCGLAPKDLDRISAFLDDKREE